MSLLAGDRKTPLLTLWPAVVLGMVAFFAITGGKILDPTRTAWLMNGDPTTAWLGWEFFRQAPLLQWPLGANPNYGLAIGSSIVFSDSIPLLALLFKPFSALLPTPFQYLGFWLLCCFVLQAVFAWKLLSICTESAWLKLLGTVFFLIAPALVWRLHQHYALAAHWIVLAALYGYFSRTRPALYWMALLVAAVLVHAFLFVMAGVIWAADLVHRLWSKQTGPRNLALYALACVSAVLLAMWAAGYFMLGGEPGAFGFGYYRMNLLSLIDGGEVWAQQSWSKVLRDQPQTAGDYEGFNFLGLGILCLGFVASVELSRLQRADFNAATVVPICAAALMLFVFALSNRVAYGAHEVLVYPWPEFALKIGNAFRSSGRMFWPVYYLSYLAIFFLLFRHANRRYAVAVCAALLFAQLSDSAPALSGFRERFSQAKWQTPLQAPQWNEFGKRYQKLVYVLPANTPPRWAELAHFAATHAMAINMGYLARVNSQALQTAREQLISTIRAGQLDSHALYVFEDEALWNLAQQQARPEDWSGTLDGVRVFAPRLGANQGAK